MLNSNCVFRFCIYLRPWWRRAAVIEAIEARGWLDPDAVIMILGVAPGPNPPGPQSQEHRSYQLPEAGRVHRVLLALAAVLQIVIIQRGPGQRDTLGRIMMSSDQLERQYN